MAIRTPDLKNIETNPIADDQPKKTVTKEIPVDLNDEPDTMQVEFEDEMLANSFAGKQTKPSKDAGAPKIDDNKPIDEIQNEISQYEEQKSGKLEYKDLLKQAEFFINIFDTGLSTLFNFIARGDHVSEYKMLPSDKKLLTEQLALILAKYQSRFKIEYTFLMGLVIMYAPMTLAAVKNRKKTRPAKQIVSKAQPIERKVTDAGYKHNPDVPLTKEVIEQIPKVEQQVLERIDIPGAEPMKTKKQKKTGPKEKAY